MSRFLTPRERVDLGAVEFFASIGRPLASGLEVKLEGIEGGCVAPDPPASVFSGIPVVLWGDAAGPGKGRLVMGWESGGGRRGAVLPLVIPGRGDAQREGGAGSQGPGEGETVRLLRGARLITDLESRMRAEGVGGAGVAKRREEDRITRRIKALSEQYGLASRCMALVAVVERAGDRPGDLPVTRVVPVGLAQDVMWGGYFNKAMLARGPGQASPVRLARCLREDLTPGMMVSFDSEGPSLRKGLSLGRFLPHKWRFDSMSDGDDSQAALIALASSLEPDGGMAGKTDEERVLATILALLQFVDAGHSVSAGAFRAHVKRLVEFLEAWLKREAARTTERSGKPAEGTEEAKLRADVVKQVVERGRSGRALRGDWSKPKPEPALWAELAAALKK